MSVTSAMVTWVVSAMLAWSPVGRSHNIADAQETEVEAAARYEQIAEALVRVTYTKDVHPVFSGDTGRARTTILELSMAYFESGFRRDVDLGIGKLSHGDSGKSHCMMQINLGRNRKSTTVLEKLIGKAWSADDLVSDRTKCFFTGHSILVKSFMACRSLPMEQRLAVYASGSCDGGHAESALRIEKARRWYSSHKPPFADAVVLEEMNKKPEPEVVDSGALTFNAQRNSLE